MRALILLALVGCKDKPKSEVVPAVPIPEVDARPLHEHPASARASYVPPPRDRWPCAFTVQEDEGIRASGRSVYHYGKRTTCRMPLSLIAQGVFGCPDGFTRTDPDGMVRERYFKYDDAGRLLEFDGHSRQRFTWDGDRLVATIRDAFDGDEVGTYRDREAEVIAVDAKHRLQERLEFVDGRLTKLDEYLHGSVAAAATIAWQGDRPASVDVDVRGPVLGSVQRQYLYDCR